MCSVLSLLLLVNTAATTSSTDFGGVQPRFICTPIPANADPACFPSASGPNTGSASAGGPFGAGHQSAPPPGWWGASEEAKATILHLRESLVQQKETILDQRETIRELTAKLTLCEGVGHGGSFGAVAPPLPSQLHYYTGVTSHHADHSRHYHPNHQGNGNLIPDSPQHSSDGSHHGKEKQVTVGDATSSPEQMERILQALKERLNNLQVSSKICNTNKLCASFTQKIIKY